MRRIDISFGYLSDVGVEVVHLGHLFRRRVGIGLGKGRVVGILQPYGDCRRECRHAGAVEAEACNLCARVKLEFFGQIDDLRLALIVV